MSLSKLLRGTGALILLWMTVRMACVLFKQRGDGEHGVREGIEETFGVVELARI